MPLETTEKYKQKLDQIRREPQETEEQKEAKKEHAREFRMEVMLDNARLTENLTAELECHLWPTKDDLMASLKKSAEFLAHPEVAEVFIADLLATQKRVLEVIDKKMIEQDGKHVAEAFYHELVREKFEQYKFHGKMDLDTSYPLAVVLYIENDEDFKRIDPRRNIGGFYNSCILLFDSTSGKTLWFPLIVVRGTRDNSIQSGVVVVEGHEKGHAEHKRFKSAVNLVERKSVWLDLGFPDQVKIGWLVTGWKTSSGVVDKALDADKLNEWFDETLDYALERAKDELLAEFKMTGSLKYYLQNLFIQGGVYDYFGHLGINSGSDLYNDLWNKYKKVLQSAVDSAEYLLESYRRLGLSSRVDSMRWVLAQIPLKHWEHQLRESAFWKEAQGLRDIRSPRYSSRLVFHEAFEEFVSGVRREQGHSFMPQIRQFYTQVEGIED